MVWLPSAWTEVQTWTNSNRKLPGISYSCIISWLSKEFIFYCTVRDWNCLPDDAVHTTHRAIQGSHLIIKLYLRYTASYGERESRPFHCRPVAFNLLLKFDYTMKKERKLTMWLGSWSSTIWKKKLKQTNASAQQIRSEYKIRESIS